MLEDIIKNELIKFSENPSRQKNPKVKLADIKVEKVIENVNKKDTSLGKELEEATDWLMISYADMYFAEGFKVALRLIHELDKISQKK